MDFVRNNKTFSYTKAIDRIKGVYNSCKNISQVFFAEDYCSRLIEYYYPSVHSGVVECNPRHKELNAYAEDMYLETSERIIGFNE